MTVAVRPAHPDEHAAVAGVLDAAMLEIDADTLRERIPEGVLVAVDGERVLGALVLDGVGGTDGRPRTAIEAVAVRRARRGQGIGTALVEAAARSFDGRLVAEFDPDIRPFYEKSGFAIEPAGEGRYRGVLE